MIHNTQYHVNGYILTIEKSAACRWYGVAIRKPGNPRKVGWVASDFQHLHLALMSAVLQAKTLHLHHHGITTPPRRQRTMHFQPTSMVGQMRLMGEIE